MTMAVANTPTMATADAPGGCTWQAGYEQLRIANDKHVSIAKEKRIGTTSIERSGLYVGPSPTCKSA